MLRRTLMTLSTALMMQPAFAQDCPQVDTLALLSSDQRAELDAAVARDPFPRGLLWQATRGEDTITLLGTFHLPDPGLAPIVAQASGFLDDAELLFLEADAEAQTALQRDLATRPGLMMIEDGPTLIDLLPEEEWTTLSAALSKRGVPGFMAAKMQPWFVTIMLAAPVCKLQQMQAGAKGVDGLIEAEAAVRDVPTASLEPHDLMFELFAEAPIDEQIEMVRSTMAMMGDADTQISGMISSYLDEEHRRIVELGYLQARATPGLSAAELAEMNAQIDQFESELLENRNRNWMPVIYEALETRDDIMVAAGAAHLSGQAGLLALLEADGFALTRIELEK